MAHTAQCANNGGSWRLYVVLFGETEWPECRWSSGQVPTVAERRAALAALGYEPLPHTEWRWIEDSAIPGDDSTAVLLIASTDVRELPAGGAA
ncbi:DUF6303 family protein [Streptomyces sp. NPDC059017]|uniref:DUF6303 family protein n=1 Tax=unclassified Streptomyces TaxID=2593676 RepID=UPI00343F3051